jgi:cytochrome c peroxidase
MQALRSNGGRHRIAAVWRGMLTIVLLAPFAMPAMAEAPRFALDQLKLLFQRPSKALAPFGVDAERVALGARLFNDKQLSANHAMSCASCHKPALGFVDGRRRARGNTGQDLPRNTPAHC